MSVLFTFVISFRFSVDCSWLCANRLWVARLVPYNVDRLCFSPPAVLASEINDKPDAGNDRDVVGLPLVLDQLKVR